MSFFKQEDISAERGTVICQRLKEKPKYGSQTCHWRAPDPSSVLFISFTARLLIPLLKTGVEVGDTQLASQLPLPKSQANVAYSQCAHLI